MNKYELKIHHEDNNFIRYCYSEYNLKENSLVKLNDGTYGTILFDYVFQNDMIRDTICNFGNLKKKSING